MAWPCGIIVAPSDSRAAWWASQQDATLLWTWGGFAAPPQDCFSSEADQKLNVKQPMSAAVFGRGKLSCLSPEGAGRPGIWLYLWISSGELG